VTASGEIRIGISACLLGEPVRYDGGHKRDSFLADVLGRFVRFVPVCPEVELGLGTPRETLRLVRGPDGLHMIANGTGRDLTRDMRTYAEARGAELQKRKLSGYVLKADSPSCGMERVKVYGTASVSSRSGRGLFAEALLRLCPLLPIEEEGRLQDLRLRENFVERVFGYHRLRRCFSPGWKLADLAAFHTAEKYLILAHDPHAYRRLGRLVANAKHAARAQAAAAYQEAFMGALKKLATPQRHTNVLQQLAGFFKDRLGKAEKAELREVTGDFRRGLAPLVVPVTLLRHYTRIFGVAYLEGQTYLEPHPKELMLRNHV
jgi:uncharacterized protein YbgA (DUF1722 family)/uncharacterized protein YbbK (DUF523 family)